MIVETPLEKKNLYRTGVRLAARRPENCRSCVLNDVHSCLSLQNALDECRPFRSKNLRLARVKRNVRQQHWNTKQCSTLLRAVGSRNSHDFQFEA